MLRADRRPIGAHFLQIPGPSPVPERILRALSQPTIDHRGPDFAALGLKTLRGVREIFKTRQPVVIYSGSGTGAWEAARVNTMSAGDHLLMYETGHFASLWIKLARRLGLVPEVVEWAGEDPLLPEAPGWRRGVSASLIEDRLRRDRHHKIKAVCVVHNETSTGVTSDIVAVRAAIDAAKHPALLMVDAISSLASVDYRHDEWGVDVTISGSQKGLMMPPGLSFNVASARALDAMNRAQLPRSYWAWDEIIEMNQDGFWPSTPSTNLLFGLAESLDMILGEGLDNVFARHLRWAEAVRAAVRAWGADILCADAECFSPVLTGVLAPPGIDADAFRQAVLQNFDMSLGSGLGKLKGQVFRIGHLGNTNDLTLIAAIAGCEMGLKMAGANLSGCGVQTAMDYFADHPAPGAVLGAHRA